MYSLKINVRQDIVESKISGTLDAKCADELISRFKSITVGEHIEKWIIDVRLLEIEIGIGEVFFHLRKHAFLLSKKVSLITPKEQKEFYMFLEDASYNRGFNIKSFASLADARRWLRKD